MKNKSIVTEEEEVDLETLEYLRQHNTEYRWNELEERMWKIIGVQMYCNGEATNEQLIRLDRFLCDIEMVIEGKLTSF